MKDLDLEGAKPPGMHVEKFWINGKTTLSEHAQIWGRNLPNQPKGETTKFNNIERLIPINTSVSVLLAFIYYFFHFCLFNVSLSSVH